MGCDPRVVVLVQARLGSARLPGKCLRALAGRPMIRHVLERARAVRSASCVVLATSDAARDDPLVAEALEAGVEVYRGSEWDVLGRMREAADAFEAAVVVRLTGDCPFLDPVVVDAVVAFHAADPLGAPFADNDTCVSGFPDGTDAEVLYAWLLREAADRATDRGDREHVTRWVKRHRMTATLRHDRDLSSIKLSVDSPEDYQFARQLAGRIPAGDFSLAATVGAVEAMAKTEL